VLAFVAVAAVLIVTPGPDMALVLRNTVRGGRAAGLRTVAGTGCGLAVWALASAVGVATLVAASTRVFAVWKLAGGVYLVYLGVRALVAARRGEEAPVRARSGSPFRQGLLSNLLNPKLAVLFTTLLPQFVAHDDPAWKPALLALVFVAMGLAWLVTYAFVVGAVVGRRWLARAAEAVAGVAMIALGSRLAFTRR
jgi:threonine/homoserine/homoserine lactone efflux protein